MATQIFAKQGTVFIWYWQKESFFDQVSFELPSHQDALFAIPIELTKDEINVPIALSAFRDKIELKADNKGKEHHGLRL